MPGTWKGSKKRRRRKRDRKRFFRNPSSQEVCSKRTFNTIVVEARRPKSTVEPRATAPFVAHGEQVATDHKAGALHPVGNVSGLKASCS